VLLASGMASRPKPIASPLASLFTQAGDLLSFIACRYPFRMPLVKGRWPSQPSPDPMAQLVHEQREEDGDGREL